MKLTNLIPETVFREKGKVFPYQWDKIKKNYLNQNPNTKSVISKKDGTEYLIHKDKPTNVLLKYDKDNITLYHDMKSNELTKLIHK